MKHFLVGYSLLQHTPLLLPSRYTSFPIPQIGVEDRKEEGWNFEGIFGMMGRKVWTLPEGIYGKKARWAFHPCPDDCRFQGSVFPPVERTNLFCLSPLHALRSCLKDFVDKPRVV